jgi:sulfatase maturation enzyme AslB (radical SAM superfamily)
MISEQSDGFKSHHFQKNNWNNMNLTGITWLTTYNCNLNCEHCFFNVRGDKKYMEPDLVEAVFDSLGNDHGMFWQHLSGGEIFIDSGRLMNILEIIHKNFQKNIGLSTNGFWAKKRDQAAAILDQLKERGVNGIAVSMDYYHSKWLDGSIPEGLLKMISEKDFQTHSYAMGAVLQEEVEGADAVNISYSDHFYKNTDLRKCPQAPTKVRSIGRGAYINIPKQQYVPEGKCTDLSECLGKRSPFNPAMVWIDCYGNVMVCYGIIIGNLYKKEMKQILAEYNQYENDIVNRLIEGGPRNLFLLAQEKGWQHTGYFFDKCDMCFQSRKYLKDFFPDTLGPDECYP